MRAFLTAALVSLFWIVTAWSSGPLALTFAIVIAVLIPLQGDRAYAVAMLFLLGSSLSAVLAAVLTFGVLPSVVTFPGLCLALGLVLVPLGVGSPRPGDRPSSPPPSPLSAGGFSCLTKPHERRGLAPA